MIKKKLTEVAVDAFTEYVKERITWLKQFDLDKDGQKDVDQIIEIVVKCGSLCKDALGTTNFPQIATGLEQIIGGVTLIRDSLDKEKLAEMGKELSIGCNKLGELAQLSIQYAKEKGPN